MHSAYIHTINASQRRDNAACLYRQYHEYQRQCPQVISNNARQLAASVATDRRNSPTPGHADQIVSQSTFEEAADHGESLGSERHSIKWIVMTQL
jgi:hypothetical protein